ncbi:TetR/AcrR family transcriptional regulator [Salmonella enterica subsp. enterica]|uniref:TetR/AcrR family transcriptional regulator n=4 Tax=Salmonella enterica I TaxID=59201 RepID=A0A624B0G0_SALMO|nr:TetR/AcrR family transcriptional regulator [Salmonella enterica]EAC2143338.1 TetR/AcrR family transcriptional regulator [Salmonella enterica subsp. enterica]EBZ6047355.1 TetR/AcrR family transcriptional regulator [Salmonella enterica subsp. enterica serovar Texas]ECS6014728.1 TetR/AcrR family transcriptional regulator [Salmonella enterica subsp. enterica serovar Rough O:k:1,5]ECS7545193.1 TetR/AcrR family transcriptional regulator [Salmonella enterica subsp. enterica serovar Denver]ECZ52603
MYIDTSNAQSLKEKLLLCAVNEFAEYGYEGARVDNIVKAADCSKQTVYHHFGNKENLFIEVLEYTWNDIRQKEKALDVSGLSPAQAIEKIIDFTWNYYIANPWFLNIVHSENQSKGVHYAKSKRLPEINYSHLELMASLLEKGKALNIFKQDIDPLQVNINIAALGGYYLINQHTLGLVYHISMVSPQALEARRKVIKETIMSWLLIDKASIWRE